MQFRNPPKLLGIPTFKKTSNKNNNKLAFHFFGLQTFLASALDRCEDAWQKRHPGQKLNTTKLGGL